jgi:hypothetical protein
LFSGAPHINKLLFCGCAICRKKGTRVEFVYAVMNDTCRRFIRARYVRAALVIALVVCVLGAFLLKPQSKAQVVNVVLSAPVSALPAAGVACPLIATDSPCKSGAPRHPIFSEPIRGRNSSNPLPVFNKHIVWRDGWQFSAEEKLYIAKGGMLSSWAEWRKREGEVIGTGANLSSTLVTVCSWANARSKAFYGHGFVHSQQVCSVFCVLFFLKLSFVVKELDCCKYGSGGGCQFVDAEAVPWKSNGYSNCHGNDLFLFVFILI